MEFLVIAYDGTDHDALERRMAVREVHLKNARRLVAAGHIVEGGAILDEAGQMIGSAVIVDFPSREALDDWLNTEPYIIHGVWQTIEIKPFRLAPLRPNHAPAQP